MHDDLRRSHVVDVVPTDVPDGSKPGRTRCGRSADTGSAQKWPRSTGGTSPCRRHLVVYRRRLPHFCGSSFNDETTQTARDPLGGGPACTNHNCHLARLGVKPPQAAYSVHAIL